ncbi:calcineurin-like phosphoesterase family protein [Flavobacterium sp. HSC-61S13]|uniref:calcineurin-like phosphoesterase family protein n=1 Tax=Flavobacterium sp. HSC-61S13 TaxID=2910963 RepID=UPI00209E150B|nr:calcineurin-like phosphoesterase family protein [Flavobacterium sp. HSC-61S13]MCP1997054.1 hypothetical protein [Flavobacterium sp. HSC-61S13]
MKKTVWIIVGLFSMSLSFAQTKVKGYVYEDSNKNGKRDSKERGLVGVAVSNGQEVVLTNDTGLYELPIGDDNQIFVIKPSHYAFLLDEFNLPKFYYTYKPKGSPTDFKYAGVAPTGKLPKELNFGLVPQKEESSFKAFLFGDPQPYSMQELDYFKKSIIDEAKEKTAGISFGISLGDLVGDDLSLHLPYKQYMKEMNLPWYNVIGNHDMNYEAKTDILSDETYEKNFGPSNFAFNYSGAHFLVLDDILYPNPRGTGGYLGGFRDDQLLFIENDLRHVDQDKLIVVSFHIPLFVGDEKHFEEQARQQLFDLLSRFDNVLLVSAHMHMQTHQFYSKDKGWKGSKPLHEYNAGTTSGDWYSGELDESGVPVGTMRDGTPRGYAVLSVNANQYQLDYKVIGKPENYKMEIFMPQVIGDKRSGNSQVYANIFMGTELDRVEYRVDQGEWTKMTKEETFDPSFYAKVQRWDLSDTLLEGRRPSNAVNSAHLWKGKLPFHIGLGTHTVEIRVKDMFDRVYTDQKSYRIEKKK